jgi:hypothetical protein
MFEKRPRRVAGPAPDAPSAGSPKSPRPCGLDPVLGSPPNSRATAEATALLKRSRRSADGARARAWSDWPRSSGHIREQRLLQEAVHGLRLDLVPRVRVGLQVDPDPSGRMTSFGITSANLNSSARMRGRRSPRLRGRVDLVAVDVPGHDLEGLLGLEGVDQPRRGRVVALVDDADGDPRGARVGGVHVEDLAEEVDEAKGTTKVSRSTPVLQQEGKVLF